MSSNFPFLPRNLVKRAPKAQPIQPSTSVVTPKRAPAAIDLSATINPIVHKQKFTDEDYVHCIYLALSDASLLVNPDLRYKMDMNDGFIPLRHLLLNTPILKDTHLEALESAVVKALRSLVSKVIEVRLLLAPGAPSSWYGFPSSSSTSLEHDPGSYEIRRCDWEEFRSHSPVEENKWASEAERTVYLENIPTAYRQIPRLLHFIFALLSEPPQLRGVTAPPSFNRIQSVFFPSHHQDEPHSIATSCKGFALLTFRDTMDATGLLTSWSWLRENLHRVGENDNQLVPEVLEAQTHGLRTISKKRWKEMREEYLTYRSALTEESLSVHGTDPSYPPASKQPVLKPTETDLNHTRSVSPSTRPVLASGKVIDLMSPYPFGCLLFVRNVHPETNKTALRKLFGRILLSLTAASISGIDGDGIDYVDFLKGMDNCYLRLSTPSLASTLAQYFATNTITQRSGLDDVGSNVEEPQPSFSVEVVLGRREELYWEKVPAKIREKAVQKAVGVETERGSRAHEERPYVTEQAVESEHRKRKKRRP